MGTNILADNNSVLDSRNPNDSTSIISRDAATDNVLGSGKLNKLLISKIDGPFIDSQKQTKYVSRKHTYTYYAIINNEIVEKEIKKVKWAVSYDDSTANNSFYLFAGGFVENGRIKVDIKISEGVEKFKIYAYTGDYPDKNTPYIEVFFKKSITFFIGGAGDKEKNLGFGPSYIVRDEALRPYISKLSSTDLLNPNNVLISENDVYLGYNEIYKMDRIRKNILSKIKDKKGVSVNIVGHSLGGWNGAYLSTILSNLGYNVNLLITLDPVGTKYGVTLVSDIYLEYPVPKSKYWVNIQTNPEIYDGDDYIAWLGGQWEPDKRTTNNYLVVPYHHREVDKMFSYIIAGKNTTEDFLLIFTAAYLNSK